MLKQFEEESKSYKTNVDNLCILLNETYLIAGYDVPTASHALLAEQACLMLPFMSNPCALPL